ncbi:putative nuclease HARBI1 [Pleurodeles waltl]|uniref:putative nuclease HARBI1 n=1 Tax=Pleurodeles waltl TaxID=8319 RepID=UPI00370952CE
MSQLMFSNLLRDVLCGLIKRMSSYIRFLQRADLPTIKPSFYAVANVSHGIGAVDGTHIALVPPRRNEQVYRNSKNLHSVNVQVVCLKDQFISQVMAKYPGSVPDSYIMWNSSVPHMMAPLKRDRIWLISTYSCICMPLTALSAHCTFVSLPYCPPGPDMPCLSMHTGDSGCPNLLWLLTPMRRPSSAAEDNYNEANGHTRWATERCFGLLQARFQCLHVSRGALLYNPQKVCQIIVACCMLHNLALMGYVPLLDAEEGVAVPVADEEDMESDEEEDDEDAADSGAEIIQHYFG